MRLNPPIAVLTLIAAAFAVMGVANLAGECGMSTETERTEPAKVLLWLKAKLISPHETCDILTYEPRGGDTRVFAVSRPDGMDVGAPTYRVYVAQDGSTKVIAEFAQSIGGVLKIERKPVPHTKSAASTIKFKQAMALLAPLRHRAVEENEHNFRIMVWARNGGIASDGKTIIHKCLDEVTDHPGDGVEFWTDSHSVPLMADSPSGCQDLYTKAAALRIEAARKLAYDAAGFHHQFKPRYFP